MQTIQKQSQIVNQWITETNLNENFTALKIHNTQHREGSRLIRKRAESAARTGRDNKNPSLLPVEYMVNLGDKLSNSNSKLTGIGG